MKVRQTIAEAQKCFGENVVKHSLLIITKYHDRVQDSAKAALEHECKTLGLRYIYFNTSFDRHIVQEPERTT